MSSCDLCNQYIQDTLGAAAIIEFSARRVARIHPHLAGISYEIRRNIDSVFAQVDAYRGYKNQLEMMMTFTGLEKMLAAFYEHQVSIHRDLVFWSDQLADAGVGRPDMTLGWLHRNFYKIFTNIVDVHREHTKAQPVGAAAVPAIELYGCVFTQNRSKVADAEKKSLADRDRSFREEEQFEDIDDLYL